METSVVVLAHNEASRIGRCLDSLMAQSKKPDEIVVVAHNCTDDTEKIVARYPAATLVSYQGPPGVVFARMKAFEEARHEYVASIDGDSFADQDWLKELTDPLDNPGVAAAGGLVLFDSGRGALVSFGFFYLRRFYFPGSRFYFWGANFSCRKSDYRKVGGLAPLVPLKEKLGLSRWTDDVYLSFALGRTGKIVFVPSAKVHSIFRKEENAPERSRRAHRDMAKLANYFRNTET